MLLWRFTAFSWKYSQIHKDPCDNLIHYLVMHTHMKPDSTVDTLWFLHETRNLHHGHFNALAFRGPINALKWPWYKNSIYICTCMYVSWCALRTCVAGMVPRVYIYMCVRRHCLTHLLLWDYTTIRYMYWHVVNLFMCALVWYADNLQLKVVTVATAETDGYRRFMRSANMFNLDVQV